MKIRADQITIAVTVYDRRQYLAQAIASALNQTVPVRVIVVEDCGPDPTLEAFVKDRFGSQAVYYRNPRRRGLFDNWNACIERCQTPWLSILHDDDFLAPDFIAAMQELFQKVPGRGLYFGETVVVDAKGAVVKPMDPPLNEDWRSIEVSEFLHTNLIGFPGHLFGVEDARAVGGFRPTSLFCGDWEMWVKLTAHCGAAQIGRPVGYLRHHDEWGRGTNRVARSGKKQGLIIVQHKRTLARLRASGGNGRFDRRKLLGEHPMATKFLVGYARFFPPRLLAYNHRLLVLSSAPHWLYAIFQWFARAFGSPFIRLVSRIWCFARQRLSVGK